MTTNNQKKCVYCGEPLDQLDIEVGSDTHEMCLYNINLFNDKTNHALSKLGYEDNQH